MLNTSTNKITYSDMHTPNALRWHYTQFLTIIAATLQWQGQVSKMTPRLHMKSYDCTLPTLLSQAEVVSDHYPVEFQLQGRK